MRGEREERLMPAVADALDSAGAKPADIARIVCGAGPGSFTSLRIAAAIAKGLASAMRVPLYAVSSLALAAVGAGPGRWVVTLDALRGEVYAAAFAWDGVALEELSVPAIVGSDAITAMARALDATACAGFPRARAAGPLLSRLTKAGPVDLASWEPSYGRLAEAQVRWEAAHGGPLAP
jgi:tRNA threonylcarbamoyladenosine biosynthesis protein TsaB